MRLDRGALIAVRLLVLTCLTLSPTVRADEPADPSAETQPEQKGPFPQRFDAPPLEGGKGWLNTSRPLSWEDLKGKVVLLDFWTYCCINCIHVLPDLEFLEEKYAKELVVIGVHSAKFENEQDTEAIRSAIQRYEIKHPVINDAEMKIWRSFGSRSWPTLVIVDPEGKYIGYVSGEGNREVLDNVIAKLVEYHREQGTLNEKPLNFDLELAKVPETPVEFPGKIHADAENNWLFISDSNHNRILIGKLDGTITDVVGNGDAGLTDGDYATATFDHPQGMELVGTKLYVADTENHAIRVIDLEKKQVSTLAGSGKQASFRSPGGKLSEVALNSPWALRELNGVLYVAMAGPHQLWKHELGSSTIEVFAGSGREDIIDGPLLNAALAQPSGITTDGTSLYFVDSEGSAVRKVDLEGQKVTTLAGPRDLPRGRSLFEFGDIDKPGEEARFQHPIGLAYHNQKLYIADSYNHKIRTVDLTTGEVSTLIGTGQAGSELGETPRLSEPAGLSVANNTLYIADTNNHRILTVNLETREVRQLNLSGVSDTGK